MKAMPSIKIIIIMKLLSDVVLQNRWTRVETIDDLPLIAFVSILSHFILAYAVFYLLGLI